MDRLKKYKVFESLKKIDNFIDDIDDILIYLKDDGFNIGRDIQIGQKFYSFDAPKIIPGIVQKSNDLDSLLDDNEMYSFYINILKLDNKNRNNDFDINEIKETVIRIVEYSKSNGYDHTIFNNNSDVPEKIEDFIRDCDDDYSKSLYVCIKIYQNKLDI